MRWLLALFCLSVASVSQAAFTETIIRKTPSAVQSPAQPATGGAQQERLIDKVLVIKSERRLQLISRGEPLKTYRISLGKQPKGAKQREGDKKTPKGCTGLTGARSATATTWPCTSPTRTSPTPPRPAAKACPPAA